MIKKLLLGLTALLFFTACGDDDDDSVQSNISFSTKMTVNDEPYVPGNIYDFNGVPMALNIAKYYIGGITITTSEETIDLGDDLYILAEENGTFNTMIATATAGASITSIAFHVGVSNDVNAMDEATFLARAEEDPLGAQDVAMHWTWNSGYRFLRLDGSIDSNNDGVIDATDTPVAYHTGTNPLRRDLTFTSQQTITIPESGSTIEVTMDLADLFTGIDLSLPENHDTHTSNNLPLATTISDNIVSAMNLGILQ